MGFVFKDATTNTPPSHEEINKAKSEAKEIQMTEDMTNRLWEVINENTELKQQLYMAENKLEQIKRLL